MRATKATIIGGGKIESLPEYDFNHSFGLNFTELKTKYGFAGHDSIIAEYYAKQIPFIGVFPTFDFGVYPHGCEDYIKNDTEASRNNDYTDDDVRHFIRSAIENKNIGYPNLLTALHLAIYFCIKNKYTVIDLYGCQNNYDLISESELREYLTEEKIKSCKIDLVRFHREAAPIMRRYTDKMIDISKEFGIKINRYE